MYPYLTIDDRIEVVHSDIQQQEDGPHVQVHFERPNPEGFDSVRFDLPSYKVTFWEGSFSDEELSQFADFIARNAHLIYRYAAQGGLKIA